MSDEAYTINVRGLEQLLKALKAKPPRARIGVLQDSNARAQKGTSNAEVGAAHEYGAPARGIPERSFLRVPISNRLQKELEASGAFDKDVMKEVLRAGTVLPWVSKMAAVAKKIVLGAFDSAGYGLWPSWKSPTYENNTGMILVDTQQLRNSIMTEVKP